MPACAVGTGMIDTAKGLRFPKASEISTGYTGCPGTCHYDNSVMIFPAETTEGYCHPPQAGGRVGSQVSSRVAEAKRCTGLILLQTDKRHIAGGRASWRSRSVWTMFHCASI